jgi:hypothetical protein
MMVSEQEFEVLGKTLSGNGGLKNNSKLVYLTAFFAFAFILLLFGSLFLLPEPPSAFAGGDSERLMSYLIENRQTLLFQTYLRCLAAFLMFLFIGGAVRIAYRKTGVLTLAGIFALGGAILFTALMFISQVLNATGVLLAGETAKPEIIQAWSAAGDAMRHFNSFSVALMFGAVTVYLRQARVVRVWQTVLGVLTIPLFLVAAAGFPATAYEYLNTGALPFLPLFPLTLSIELLTGRRKSSARQAI